MPEIQTENHSVLEVVGNYTAILCLLAVVIGVLALIMRKQKFNVFGVLTILSIALAGLGATFYGFSEMTSMHRFEAIGPDPSSFMLNFSFATARAGFVLPACSLGLFMVSVATLLTNNKEQKTAKKTQQTAE